jgi:micrococcal nuclease
MQKTALIFGLIMISVIPHSRADILQGNTSPVHLSYDTQNQVRNGTPIKIQKPVDATTLLSDDGTIYSLTGLDIPDDGTTAPLALKRLNELASGKSCTLYQTRNDKKGRLNRMNQTLGHLTCGKDENWLQGTLLSEGLARVRTTPENNQLASMMLILESTARSKKLGLWALPANLPLNPTTAATHINSFQLVEGKIYSAAQTKDAIFLNFTPDWKTDFSIGIPSKLRRDFSKLHIDPLALKGQTIRVRGWMRDYNGPYIELDHAEQLELIADQPPSDGKSFLSEFLPQQQNPAAPTSFMHTIGGGSSPTIPEPKAPAIDPPHIDKPTIEKPTLTITPKPPRTLNP